MKKQVIDLSKVADELKDKLGEKVNVSVVGLHCRVLPEKDQPLMYANQLGYGDFDFDIEHCVVEAEVADDVVPTAEKLEKEKKSKKK